MENQNPFKELVSDATCPPNLKTELVSEIDLIRNAITVIELYVGDLFGIASALVNQPYVTSDKTHPPV
ncbi:hypothetical protein HMF3257_27540 [Spirosoma telluris]|uniref:Uncharacterized protein n=1 Tax=Spirosoma telluris TaxID=2183553 RepID=A0A327NTB2_9BACT|nr:hypothetical protein HMF3257_27540 [Spirosoma telluris]